MASPQIYSRATVIHDVCPWPSVLSAQLSGRIAPLKILDHYIKIRRAISHVQISVRIRGLCLLVLADMRIASHISTSYEYRTRAPINLEAKLKTLSAEIGWRQVEKPDYETCTSYCPPNTKNYMRNLGKAALKAI